MMISRDLAELIIPAERVDTSSRGGGGAILNATQRFAGLLAEFILPSLVHRQREREREREGGREIGRSASASDIPNSDIPIPSSRTRARRRARSSALKRKMKFLSGCFELCCLSFFSEKMDLQIP